MKLLVPALLLLIPNATPAQSLQTTLAQMDAASARFQNARADFRSDLYERIVRDTTTQTGSVYFERKGAGIAMGMVAVNSKTGAKDKVISYTDGVLQMFDPGPNQLTVIHAGGNQAQYEGFLTLGIGASGKDLARSWNIKDLGAETLTDDGKPVPCEKLDLTSKAEGKPTFTHITLWIDTARGLSLKQIYYTAAGDTRTVTYSHIRLNTKLDRETFVLKTDKHTAVNNR